MIRSRRKTIGLEIQAGRLLVRAPMHTTDAEIQAILAQHRAWIEEKTVQTKAARQAAEGVPKLTQQELEQLGQLAVQVFPQRVQHYAPLIGVSWGRITIRCQRTKWGSCSSKGNLNFNCLLMLAPPEVLDSIVVHELCHRKFMNHSPAFYAEVLRVFPEYRKWERWLKEHGAELMSRVPE